MRDVTAGKKVLVLYYSLSHQTKNLLRAVANGLGEEGISVVFERLRPLTPLRFPFGTLQRTIGMMLITFVRRRIPIEPLSDVAFDTYDLIILGGPTWSYNPSGPVLAMLDRDGPKLVSGRMVLPLISCRGYWRAHWFGLRLLLRRCGAILPGYMVFSHPSKEPWRTLGVFLKLAGRTPEKMSWLKNRYPKYGHTRHQMHEAHRFGAMLGKALREGNDLSLLDFRTGAALS